MWADSMAKLVPPPAVVPAPTAGSNSAAEGAESKLAVVPSPAGTTLSEDVVVGAPPRMSMQERMQKRSAAAMSVACMGPEGYGAREFQAALQTRADSAKRACTVTTAAPAAAPAASNQD
jgi:hypothetical protein